VLFPLEQTIVQRICYFDICLTGFLIGKKLMLLRVAVAKLYVVGLKGLR
jgi:hypothetical protein